MNNIVGIVGAMDVEVSTLCQKLQNKEVVKFGGLEFNHGFLNSKEVVIVKSGVGKVNAALCVQTLVNKFNVTQIINTGIAGATGKGLGVFDFVISSEVAYHDVDVQIFGYKIGQIPGQEQFFVADEQLVQKAVQVAQSSSFTKEHKFVKGRIASGDQFIADKIVKDKIIQNFDPMCVEMEGAAIAHACTVNAIPFVIIRCLSDCADDSVNSVYSFNEETCAKMCADFVENFVNNL